MADVAGSAPVVGLEASGTNTGGGAFWERVGDAPWVWRGIVVLSALLLMGRPVPSGNEPLYLLRVEHAFLLNDWTFSSPAYEHWLFNFVFGLPAYFLSLEVVGWLGRFFVWILCVVGIFRLGRLWNIREWAVAAATLVWIGFGQSVVNGEWIIGGFEAKAVAYGFLLFSLVGFAREKIHLPAVLLGLAFSFHPAVGLWAVPAILIALLSQGTAFKSVLTAAGITFLFCLPGILPLTFEVAGGDPNVYENWRYLVTNRIPWHFDPFQFDRRGLAVIFVMLAFNIFVHYRDKDYPMRFVLSFQIVIAAFFLLGVLFRWLELFPLLRFMPMRLFPVLTPLFFLFSFFSLVARASGVKLKIVATAFVILILNLLHPFDNAKAILTENADLWSRPESEFVSTLKWAEKNVEPEATLLASPGRNDVWYHSRRATIVSYRYPVFDRITEWRERVSDLAGGVDISKEFVPFDIVDDGFNNLTFDQIISLRDKYRADYLISRGDYPLPIVFQNGPNKIYRLTKEMP